eukprot:COSAG02_NODE_231_length_27944_cov_5.843347_2_plen_79_part_00
MNSRISEFLKSRIVEFLGEIMGEMPLDRNLRSLKLGASAWSHVQVSFYADRRNCDPRIFFSSFEQSVLENVTILLYRW